MIAADPVERVAVQKGETRGASTSPESASCGTALSSASTARIFATTLVDLPTFFATILNLSFPRLTCLIRTSSERFVRFLVIFSLSL